MFKSVILNHIYFITLSQLKENMRMEIDEDQDASFPAGFKEAVCEALLFVCKERLTFESLSLTGNLFVSLDQRKASHLHLPDLNLRIVESIPKDICQSSIELVKRKTKRKVESESSDCCNSETSVKVEPVDEFTGQNDFSDKTLCEESSCSVYDDNRGKLDNTCDCGTLEPKLEPKLEPDDPVDNSLSVTFEQNSPSCSNMTSSHPLSSSLMDDTPANDESQGKIVVCLSSSIFRFLFPKIELSTSIRKYFFCK